MPCRTPAPIKCGAAAAMLALAACAPATAATLVKFSFTAGGAPVVGVMTLACPPGSGPCSVVGLDGTWGSETITKDPDVRPPPPPSPPPPPDNTVTRPGFVPTDQGMDFWSGTYIILTHEDGERLRMAVYDSELDERYREYTVTDYSASVPEPSAWAILLLGFAGAGTALRLTPASRTRPPAAPAGARRRPRTPSRED